MADKSCKEKLNDYIGRAYDYIVQVLETQGRFCGGLYRNKSFMS